MLEVFIEAQGVKHRFEIDWESKLKHNKKQDAIENALRSTLKHILIDLVNSSNFVLDRLSWAAKGFFGLWHLSWDFLRGTCLV